MRSDLDRRKPHGTRQYWLLRRFKSPLRHVRRSPSSEPVDNRPEGRLSAICHQTIVGASGRVAIRMGIPRLGQRSKWPWLVASNHPGFDGRASAIDAYTAGPVEHTLRLPGREGGQPNRRNGARHDVLAPRRREHLERVILQTFLTQVVPVEHR